MSDRICLIRAIAILTPYLGDRAEEILPRFIAAWRPGRALNSEYVDSPSRIIDGAFVWSQTPQGHDYWSAISKEIWRRIQDEETHRT